ncbi:PQQ-dependent sugar dehydrogenase [Enterovibrio nigricans]|uniref:Glucose/arabinose dehydrogenase, beta-propeller fold n=1 Tax=Enterovibrio nigricans DSM 22720 TaxID=1121868 RepID=A0A1T4V0K8_9GAMM|nr:PQQ-dependent sugar dehydrogenase [Enterovibrio nigricans]PKF49801.1 PQQ-dependent sugar dehydrogenase [Enterovibrio nigricans]SKA58503.1 Glucose/arabinose dehydrogenase, beta-propeller fold [Enterovibrio nigricans DSM 22720]
MRKFALIAVILTALPPATYGEAIHSDKHEFVVETLASELNHPWSLVFLPSGEMLVSERNGQLVKIDRNGTSIPINGLPENLVARGQGGLLGLALASDFEKTGTVFIAYSEGGEHRKSGTAVAKGTLSGTELTQIQTLFSQQPKLGGSRHYGGRLVATDNSLFVALGDRGNQDKAQQNNSHTGTLVRLTYDGAPYPENPYTHHAEVLPEIYSYGHRNIQGMTLSNDGKTLWTHEHGPQGGDELNAITAGANYGWPTITYGVNYGTGTSIGIGTETEGMKQPIHYWVPSIAPSGMAMIQGSQFKHWAGDILLGSLKFGLLVRLEMEKGVVVREERMLDGKYGRIRDVIEGPDGYIYLLTDSSNGKILRLAPAP